MSRKSTALLHKIFSVNFSTYFQNFLIAAYSLIILYTMHSIISRIYYEFNIEDALIIAIK